jgi:DNA mismatch repair protein MutH
VHVSATPTPAASPPATLAELRDRALALEGLALGDIAAELGVGLGGSAVRTKGLVGMLLERALGASGGSAAVHDFPSLGIELKTIPLDPRGWPRESTFVCSFAVSEGSWATWETSWVRAKLSQVLWLPIVTPARVGVAERRVGRPLLWRPTPEQEQVLRGDFDDIVGLCGIGAIDEVTAHHGRWLQLRPKAANGRARTIAFGPEGEWLETVPRGFYLRPRFTGVLLQDPAAVP